MFIFTQIFENIFAVLGHWANVASLLVLRLLRPKASSTDDIEQQGDIKRHPTRPPPSLEYIPVYGEWERERYPNLPDARFQIPATKEHAGQVHYLRKGDLIGFGTTAMVERLPSGDAIVKTPLQNPLNPAEERMNREAVAREAEVYQRLSSGDGNDMPTIPKFLGWDAQSCTLTIEHQSNGDLATYFRDNDAASGVDLETRGKWAIQAARALASLHDKQVIHADVAPRNFLLNDGLDLRICDFAGSIFPGGPVETGAPGSRYQAGPWRRGYVPTKADDLFALGSVLYSIMTGNEPYSDLVDIEVERRFQAAEFPETGSLQYGSIIDDCWHGRLTTAQAVVQALNRYSAESSS
ncbi:Protein kinase-like domain protein [Cordyceps fumosorosea ARSEF 2679]|uniref:EKC/KEOPS complex subunit BUD32 n=1 Tax=Cordyceps fumosorosea (strain ARSEF 2679) TaxID=1081104 RepID=A0A167EVA9_CORFA|nr:Protein kinase-like domain protein [Cordyceps fumosorosea ARSEF 2679]OAA44437.1 Protein kinase-like domain protein [Cordyceps fumosorosea ARSEF 2679]